jgi:hypothetical protein
VPGPPNAHLCRYWEYTPTKRLVLPARDFLSADIDPTLLMSLAGAVASANDGLRDNTAENRGLDSQPIQTTDAQIIP